MKSLSFAVLGAGSMARNHARNLIKSGARLTAVIVRSRESGEKLRTELEAPSATVHTDFAEFLRSSGADILVAAIPPGAHRGEVEAAAAAGMHLFLEKPIALIPKAVASMEQAVQRAGVVSQVGYNRRFHKSVRRMKALLDAGKAGSPTLFQGRFWCRLEGTPAWWKDPALSGGQMFEQAVHILDLAALFLGKPVGVSGILANLGHRNQADYGGDDTGAALIRFANGAVATVTSSNCAVPERFIGDFRLVCTEAMLDFRSTGDWRDKDRGVFHMGTSVEEVIEDADPYQEEIAAFLNAIANKTPSPVPIAVGAETVRVACAIAESSRQGGQWIAL